MNLRQFPSNSGFIVALKGHQGLTGFPSVGLEVVLQEGWRGLCLRPLRHGRPDLPVNRSTPASLSSKPDQGHLSQCSPESLTPSPVHLFIASVFLGSSQCVLAGDPCRAECSKTVKGVFGVRKVVPLGRVGDWEGP